MALVAFVTVERSRRAPLVEPSLFRFPTLTPTLLASLFQAVANFAAVFRVLTHLQGVYGLSPPHASLLLVPGDLVAGIAGPSCGRLADRLGAVWPATLGLGIQIAALAVSVQFQVTASLVFVIVGSILNGMGAGAFMPANNSAVMKVAPGEDFSIASEMLRTFANIGMVFSFAVAVLVAARSISRRLPFAIFLGTATRSHRVGVAFTAGLHAAFLASICFMTPAALLSATRNRQRRHRASEAGGERTGDARAARGWR